MGQTFSIMRSVWDSFSLPYRAAIVISFILWLVMQRKRALGLFIAATFKLTATMARHSLGRKLHPTWGVKEEAGTLIVRHVFSYCEPDFVRPLTQLGGKLKLEAQYPIKEVKMGAFSGWWYGVDDPDAKVLLFAHGGAYVYGSALMFIKAFNGILDSLQKAGVKCAIFAPEYTLAPKGSFPTPVNEVVASYEYLLKNLSIGPNRIILMGDSAGGALTLACCYQIRESLPPPAGLVLISPWVDSRDSEGLRKEQNIKYDYLHPDLLTYGVESYLKGQSQNHLSSPIMGVTQGLPPMLVVYGGLELFASMIQEFIQKVKSENGEEKVTVYCEPNVTHDFPMLPEMFEKQALNAQGRISDFIAETFKQFD